MEHKFKEGQEVAGIYFAYNEEDGQSSFLTGVSGVEKITVVLENGQMAGVPWFAVWKDGKIDSKWNGAMLEGVQL